MEKPSPEEFVFLLARHERLLGAYVSTLVPQPADADDVLQEAKLVMWRAFGQFQVAPDERGWHYFPIRQHAHKDADWFVHHQFYGHALSSI